LLNIVQVCKAGKLKSTGGLKILPAKNAVSLFGRFGMNCTKQYRFGPNKDGLGRNGTIWAGCDA
jgi:hypothetical protein